MKNKTKKTVFILQLSEGCLKIVKCLPRVNAPSEIIGLGLHEIASRQELGPALAKEGFQSNEIVVALPRNQATCRFLKLPGKNPEDLEKICALQAGLYLPYPSEELVTAYQAIQTAKDGFSEIILTICHRNAISNYLEFFTDKAKRAKLNIILSSYGICNLFYHFKPEENATVMLIDMDEQQTELVIAAKAKVLFSRSVRIEKGVTGWEALLATEIIKTADAFVKEARGGQIQKMVILDAKSPGQETMSKIEEQAGIAVEFINYAERLKIKPEEAGLVVKSSFASLLGLCLKNLPDSLSILPKAIKETKLNLRRRREILKLAILVIGIFFAFSLGIAKNLENKEMYLRGLEKRLSGIAKEAKSLEDIEKRFKLIADNSKRKDSPLALLYELHRLMPDQARLINLNYEENQRVLLRGETVDINDVFNLISALEQSPAFAKFNIKIKFATRKKTQSGEIIDFEIVCARQHAENLE